MITITDVGWAFLLLGASIIMLVLIGWVIEDLEEFIDFLRHHNKL